MISLGPTSDIVVAGLLAISQLITPVPDSAIKKVEAELQTRHSCQDFKTAIDDYAQNKCETLKDDRKKYKEECQDLEYKLDKFEVPQGMKERCELTVKQNNDANQETLRIIRSIY